MQACVQLWLLFLVAVLYELVVALGMTWLANRMNIMGMGWLCFGLWLFGIGFMTVTLRRRFSSAALVSVLLMTPLVSVPLYLALGYHLFQWRGLMKP
jgi:hypothetical protein